ncbi:hypothetical protein LEL_10047 [Akanthomyces lecanii RCEF 1005]|uniref:Uncharacterized protein n=1 Tax=Akanthomyces lecanii RCEF 1005 TaxID=1081108 RepID=A0A168ATG7_CORDF|nr:hypothetical protein LEL_10047 [Akanthomyces lecanii RCEF 1005]
MTYDHTAFDAFHWLPEENPANIVEISSDDDNDKKPPVLSYPRHVDEPPKEVEQTAEAKAASAAFRTAIGTSIPFYFTDMAVRQKIRASGIRMLEIAVRSGIALDALFIDDNCLPGWPYRYWDPEVQSLHEVIQSRLAECQDAQELGSRLREAVVQLGNDRIQEAILLGLELGDMSIGEDLLPTWETGDQNDTWDDEDDTIMGVESAVDSEHVSPPTTDSVEEKATDAAATHEPQPPSAWSSDSESNEPESECELYDDEISLFNFLCQHPVIEENDEDAPLRNIVHDVDVVGSSFDGSGSVDFEVYLAQDDSDIEQLPEVELAIDEDAFAHHYDLADVIDLELAGGGIYWVKPREEQVDKEAPEDEEADEEMEELEELEVPECTMESPEEEGSLDEPMTPPSAAGPEALAGWIVI